MKWDLETTPGSGVLTTFEGTIEKVYAEILKINPNYDQEFDALAANSEPEQSSVEKRTDFSTSRYKCRGKWRGAVTGEIKKGIDYLRRVGGKPRLDSGKCSRVSCSWNAAIWWCNDVRLSVAGFGLHVFLLTILLQSKGTKTLNSFGSIADGAKWLTAYCTTSGDPYGFTAGQVWHPTQWNVIVMNPGPCK